MQQEEWVILVDEADNETGTMPKMKVHELGILHRAFSVLIFNEKNELLLQQRALHKYHSGGLWTNTCCSHPQPGEALCDAASRRLQEEMGISCPLQKWFHFIYKATFENGLTEHELDHVFVGRFSGIPVLNGQEAMAYRFICWNQLNEELQQDPNLFTAWFRIVIEKINAISGINKMPV